MLLLKIRLFFFFFFLKKKVLKKITGYVTENKILLIQRKREDSGEIQTKCCMMGLEILM